MEKELGERIRRIRRIRDLWGAVRKAVAEWTQFSIHSGVWPTQSECMHTERRRSAAAASRRLSHNPKIYAHPRSINHNP